MLMIDRCTFLLGPTTSTASPTLVYLPYPSLPLINAINKWMYLTFHHLNPGKTDVIKKTNKTHNFSMEVSHYINPPANIKSSTKNLGIIFDQHLNYESHMSNLIQSCFLHLRHCKLKPLLSFNNMELYAPIYIYKYAFKFSLILIILYHCSGATISPPSFPHLVQIVVANKN